MATGIRALGQHDRQRQRRHRRRGAVLPHDRRQRRTGNGALVVQHDRHRQRGQRRRRADLQHQGQQQHRHGLQCAAPTRPAATHLASGSNTLSSNTRALQRRRRARRAGHQQGRRQQRGHRRRHAVFQRGRGTTTSPPAAKRRSPTRPVTPTSPPASRRCSQARPASTTSPTARARLSNTTGDYNVATGREALFAKGNEPATPVNVAIRRNTLSFVHTHRGRATSPLGSESRQNLTTGSNDNDIANDGVAGESGTIRIGSGDQTATFIAGISGSTPSAAPGRWSSAQTAGSEWRPRSRPPPRRWRRPSRN